MKASTFKITKMDCPSEEQMIRMKLEEFHQIQALEFDIPQRELKVHHTGQAEPILAALESLRLNTTLISTKSSDVVLATYNQQGKERKLLWTVLIINASFFAIEIIAGLVASSMGLVADSLDMLADSIVYGLALFAVRGAAERKRRVAKFAGYFQIILATIGFLEVVRRSVGLESMPDFSTMILVSITALVANSICLYLLQQGKSREAHMRASMIFTSNDIIINSGVIVAGLLVNWLSSSIPDLIIGGVVFVIVAQGAYRILKL